MGDYLTAAAADQIWVQPKGNFAVAGAGAGEIFLRGLFDKVHANPQMAKRAEYKSAADMYTEKTMTGPDREQLNAVMQSWYGAALTQIAAERHLTKTRSRPFSRPARNSPKTPRPGAWWTASAMTMTRKVRPWRGPARRQGVQDERLHRSQRFPPVTGSANIAVIEAAARSPTAPPGAA